MAMEKVAAVLQRTTMKPMQTVGIHFDGKKVTVDLDPVRISIANEEQVLWSVYGDATLVSIEFKLNPFDGPIEIHPKKKHAASTTVTNLKHKGGLFKYTVTVADLNGKSCSLDPQVEVMP
jgi:hypothetical protein